MTRRPGGLMSQDRHDYVEALTEIRLIFQRLSRKDGEDAIRVLQLINERKE